MHMQGLSNRTLQNASFRMKHYDYKLIYWKYIFRQFPWIGCKIVSETLFIFSKWSVKEEYIDWHTELFQFTFKKSN